MKIGFLGGTFDPPTKAHQFVASNAIEVLKLDQLIVIPTHQNPLKRRVLTTTDAQRLEMCNMAFQNIHQGHRCEISDIEMRREGPSYTVDTVEQLTRGKDDDFWLVVGGDIVRKLPRWRRVEDLLEMVRIAAFPRLGPEYKKSLAEEVAALPEWMQARIDIMNGGTSGSSTFVRNHFHENEFDPTGILCPEVAHYIAKNELYK